MKRPYTRMSNMYRFLENWKSLIISSFILDMRVKIWSRCGRQENYSPRYNRSVYIWGNGHIWSCLQGQCEHHSDLFRRMGRIYTVRIQRQWHHMDQPWEFQANLSSALASEVMAPGEEYTNTQTIYWQWPFYVSDENDIRDTEMNAGFYIVQPWWTNYLTILLKGLPALLWSRCLSLPMFILFPDMLRYYCLVKPDCPPSSSK